MSPDNIHLSNLEAAQQQQLQQEEGGVWGAGRDQDQVKISGVVQKYLCFENQERVLSPKPESDMVLEDLEQQVTVMKYK